MTARELMIKLIALPAESLDDEVFLIPQHSFVSNPEAVKAEGIEAGQVKVRAYDNLYRNNEEIPADDPDLVQAVVII